MKNTTTRVLCSMLAASTLCSLIGCSGKTPETTTEGGTGTTTAPATEAGPLYTPEEVENFRALASTYATRANVISTATRNAYVTTASNGAITLARYYTVTSRHPAKDDVASVWHYTAFMAMASHMIQIATTDEAKKEYTDLYASLVDSLDFYKGTAPVTTYKGTSNVTYYGVNRASRKNTANVANELAVYDDQMWIIMDLMDAYEVTGTTAYFKEAVRLADICLDGWDVGVDSSGKEYGGITWGPAYTTKHTCSNGPLIEPLVSISEAYKAAGNADKADYYLKWAIKVYDWTNSHLKNGAGVFGDLLGTDRKKEGGKWVTTSQSSNIDQTAYTYNTGSVLSGAAAIYRATGEQKYLTAAENLAKRALTAFRKTSDGGRGSEKYPADLYPITSQTTWFNVILLQGFIDLAYAEMDQIKTTGKGSMKAITYIESMRDSIDYAYKNYNDKGFLPRNYVKGWDKSSEFDTKKNIMDQASAAQSYAMLSTFYKTLAEME